MFEFSGFRDLYFPMVMSIILQISTFCKCVPNVHHLSEIVGLDVYDSSI